MDETESPFPTFLKISSHLPANYRPSFFLLASIFHHVVMESGGVNRYHRFPPTVHLGGPYSLSNYSHRLAHGYPVVTTKCQIQLLLYIPPSSPKFLITNPLYDHRSLSEEAVCLIEVTQIVRATSLMGAYFTPYLRGK